MDAFIAKPVSVPALLTTIDTLTRDSETPRKPSSPPGEQPTPLPDDFTRALHAAGGDSALLLELLEILEECWDSLVAAVDEAYEKDDAAALAKALHTVKGSVNMFGFEGFVEAIAGLMETARKGSPPPRQECSELLNRQTRWQKQLRLLAGRFDQGEQR
jgi:HPt (histidine-containing phosphotransfer) domain-containing protein